MTIPVREVEWSGRGGVVRRRRASVPGPLPHAAEDGPVMPTDTLLAPAVRSETAAPYAACAGAPPPSAETLLTRIERAGPAARPPARRGARGTEPGAAPPPERIGEWVLFSENR